MATFYNCNFQLNFYQSDKGMQSSKYDSPKKIKNYYSDSESDSEDDNKSYTRNNILVRSKQFVISTRPGTTLNINGRRIIFQ